MIFFVSVNMSWYFDTNYISFDVALGLMNILGISSLEIHKQGILSSYSCLRSHFTAVSHICPCLRCFAYVCSHVFCSFLGGGWAFYSLPCVVHRIVLSFF